MRPLRLRHADYPRRCYGGTGGVIEALRSSSRRIPFVVCLPKAIDRPTSTATFARMPTFEEITRHTDPDPTENPDFYIDFGETGPYIKEIGESECAT